MPDKFYKRSQEKTAFLRPDFSCRPAHRVEQDCSGLPFPDLGTLLYSRSGLVFLASGFHHFGASKPVGSETHKQHGCQVPTMVLSGTRGP
jgi:hypothetical protein